MLDLENCSIPEESSCQILESLATCQHLTFLDLSGNQVGTSGKHLGEAIHSWGDEASLVLLNLENCSMPKEEWCELLQSIRNLIKLRKLPKLCHLVLSANKLHVIESEIGQLLTVCLTKHRAGFELFLYRNGFSKQFIKHWEETCAGTHLKPLF